jgi:type IV pilus assembly protein PilX
MKICGHYHKQTEKGVVLIVGLLILLVMTILGVASLQTTSLEEKMAGNIRDRDLALQAAESALRDAESWLETIVTVGDFDGTGGLYGFDDNADDTTWSAGDSIAYPKTHVNTIADVAAQPRFVIQYVGVIPGAKGSKNIEGYRKFKPGGDVTGFEITALGYGASSDTTVTLRTVYGRRL